MVGVVGVVCGSVDGCAGVSPAKRGRPARAKVVKEVDWLVGLSSGSGLEVVSEVRQELELVVVGDGSGGAGVSPGKKSGSAEALALK